jgi:hypothetical protein
MYRSFIESNLPPSQSSSPEPTLSATLSSPNDQIFHTFVIGESPAAIRFILLDTRSYRDPHWIRSIGEYKFIPFSALIAAGLRLVATIFGYGLGHDGDVLGNEQWQWLETILDKSTHVSTPDQSDQAQEEDHGFVQADFHVIVSSVQVFTSNPVVESWGHYPLAKRRLVDLFQKYDPSGLVFLSGDIHASEISTAQVQRSSRDVSPSSLFSSTSASTPSHWYEVTSSGLTHTCRDNFITKPICPVMMEMFPSHRSEKEKYFMERNFGVIRSFVSQPLTETAEEAGVCASPSSHLQIDIYGLPLSLPSLPVLELKIYPHQRSHCYQGKELNEERSAETIVGVEYVSFPTLPPLLSHSLIVSALLSLFIFFNLVILSLSRNNE